MEERQFQSDVLSWASYDAHSGTLIVTFKNGTRYMYQNVPQQLYLGLLDAQSAGKFFNTQISRKFKGRKI